MLISSRLLERLVTFWQALFHFKDTYWHQKLQYLAVFAESWEFGHL